MLARRTEIAIALVLPIIGLGVLIQFPQLDLEWRHQPSHFWLVLGAAAINTVLAYATGIAARRRAEPRVFLVSMAFVVSAGFLGLHALATPGILLPDSQAGFQIATPVGLFVGSLFVAWSSVDLTGDAGVWVNRHARSMQIIILGVILAWAVWSLAQIPPLHVTGDVEIGSTLVAVLTLPALFLYLLAAFRYLAVWRSTRSSIILVMAASFVLLAEAMLAVATSRSWHLSWWEWHVLMLGAFVLIAVSANRQWHEERFKDLYIRSEGGTHEVSVLFADLQGFTTFSEQHEASEVTGMLNEYFGAVIPPIVNQFGGDVDRLIGDAIMVTFNRRGDQPDHAMRAARAALELQSRSQTVADSHSGWPRFRVGVNSGDVVLGVVGAEGGRTHTVIGDAVNVASRLEGRAPVGGVVVSERTAAALSEAELEPLGRVQVKGRAEPVEVFQLLSLSPE